jgi:hypothetical protein
MQSIKFLQETARELDNMFLNNLANGDIADYSMGINYDDLSIDARYFPIQPVKFIKVDVIINKSF